MKAVNRKTILMLKWNHTISVASIALVLCGCQKIRHSVSETPGVGVVALFDISVSTDQQSLRRRYQREFSEVVEKIVPMGVVMRADAIRLKPLAETTFPIRLEVARMSVLNRNEFELQESLQKSKAATTTQLSKLFGENAPTKLTPILDAIEVSRKVFTGTDMSGIQDLRLVIFSDMIESSERYEFTRAALDDMSIRAMIEKEKRTGRLPSLKGIKVWIAGAGSGRGSVISSQQIRNIEHFWMQYFRATGADLTTNRYGSTLLNF